MKFLSLVAWEVVKMTISSAGWTARTATFNIITALQL